MTNRVRGFVNVYPDGSMSSIWDTRDKAMDYANAECDSRIAEVVELPEGASVVTPEMRKQIEQFTGSLWTAETRRAVEEILLILDGKDGA